jgi:hypothetical protein
MRVPLPIVVVVSFLAGCSGGSPVPGPQATYDPAAVAQAALDLYDKNKNGQIEGAELDACPALKAALPAIDTNKDKGLSASEIRDRVARYAAPGPVPVTITVKLDGQPLSEATVTLEPEPFMGASLKTATATTDHEGATGAFRLDGRSVAALPPGLYRLRITRDGTNLPARYNTHTTLGREVFPAPRQGEVTIDLALSSR